MVTVPVAAPAAVGSNCRSSVADCFGLSVTGKLSPVALKPLPVTVADAESSAPPCRCCSAAPPASLWCFPPHCQTPPGSRSPSAPCSGGVQRQNKRSDVPATARRQRHALRTAVDRRSAGCERRSSRRSAPQPMPERQPLCYCCSNSPSRPGCWPPHSASPCRHRWPFLQSVLWLHVNPLRLRDPLRHTAAAVPDSALGEAGQRQRPGQRQRRASAGPTARRSRAVNAERG